MAKKKVVTPPAAPDAAAQLRPPDEMPYKPDDDQLASRLAEDWKGKAAYFQFNWRVYDSGAWIERDMQEVKRNIRIFLRKHRDKLPQGVSQARINAIVAMMEDDFFIPDRVLNGEVKLMEKYINLQNGLFNLETLELEPHRSDIHITNQMDFAYDPDADCPVFKRFLRTSLATEEGIVDDKMILLAQEALAYSMTARTDFKASFWLIGKPDTGKSTMIGLIRSLMGNLHATIDLNQLAANRFLLSGIAGKRVVTFTEADSNSFLPDALYKAMVGGTDEIYVDVKNKPGFSFVPTAKFWWAMNSTPRTNDRSGATFNRLLPILFEHSIPKDQRNPNLPGQLAAEKPGIFSYLILGWQRLTKYGSFTMPERSQRWREEYKHENDTEYLFFQEELELNEKGRMGGGELYNAYRIWCENNGFKTKNLAQIAKDWRRLGLTDHHTNGHAIWTGATFRKDTVDEIF
jgi:P4 family phage/plasmid primase-like protien